MQTYLILLFYIGNIIWRCYFYCNRILDDVTMLLARFKYWAISISISTIELQKLGKIWVYIYDRQRKFFYLLYVFCRTSFSIETRQNYIGTTKKYGFWTQFGTFCGTHLWFGHNLIASQMKHYIIWSDYDNYIDIIHCEEMNAIPQSIGFIALKLEFNRNRHERAEPCIFYSW